jgi:isoleucyl-tRNA synthetase
MTLTSADPANAIAFLAGGGFVLLDTQTTPELEAEGLARDIIRSIQDTRKAAGLQVSDRIRLSIIGDSADDVASLAGFGETIGAETLAPTSSITHAPDAAIAAALGSAGGSERTTLAPGQFSNQGTLVIDVWKSDATQPEALDV